MRRFFSFMAVFFAITFFHLFANEVPRGYRNISLGMTLDETKSELLKNTDFGYRGDRDVSLLPGKQETLIETDAESGFGSNFLRRCWFQFSDGKLYVITINLNPTKIDYFSIFTTLKEKYGEPSEVNPRYSCWKNDETVLYLEKNLSLKYIDNQTMKSLQNSSNIQKAHEEISQKMFLDEL